jgi:hypothetical protein
VSACPGCEHRDRHKDWRLREDGTLTTPTGDWNFSYYSIECFGFTPSRGTGKEFDVDMFHWVVYRYSRGNRERIYNMSSSNPDPHTVVAPFEAHLNGQWRKLAWEAYMATHWPPEDCLIGGSDGQPALPVQPES